MQKIKVKSGTAKEMLSTLYPNHPNVPCVATGQFDAGECQYCKNERLKEAARFYYRNTI